MALVTHPTRTIIAVLGNQQLPSDLAGRHYVRLSPTDVDALHDLAGRLEDAGCDIDLSGRDWLHPDRFPDRDSTVPPTRERAASQPRQAATPETPQREAAQRAIHDTEARQVLVTIDAKPGERYTHLITVSTPITYPVKQVEAEIAWQENSGLAMTSTGFGGDPPRADGQRRYYTFRASVSPQIRRPEPAVRFVDLHGNRYYIFRDHTQRFPANTDWPHALTTIDEWLRTGPST